MGERRNISEVVERIGAGTADFYDKLADNIKNFACQLWNDFPDQITQNKSVKSSFARGFMDFTCGAGGGSVPPPPTSQVTGGQCIGDRYDVYFDCEYTRNDVPGTFTYRQLLTIGNNIPGAIVGGTAFPFGGQYIRVTLIWDSGNQSAFETENLGAFTDIKEITTYRFDAEKTDGSPDTCGDSPLVYPPTTPDVNNDYTTNITINNNDGTDLTIPLVYAPIDFNFPMNFDLGGVDVVIDLGGIDFNFGPGGVGDGGGQLPDGQQDPLPIPKDNPGGGNTSRKFPPPNTEDFEEIIKEPSTEDTELEGELLDYVTLQLTEIPANANTQVWVDGATVYYCGWFAFISDTFVFKREPIHFEFTIWNAPKGATGYQYQLYPGFQATATVYKRKINQDGST